MMGTATSVLRVVAQEHTPGLAEAVTIVRRGGRVAAVAVRLDAAGVLAGRRAAAT